MGGIHLYILNFRGFCLFWLNFESGKFPSLKLELLVLIKGLNENPVQGTRIGKFATKFAWPLDLKSKENPVGQG